MTVEYETQGFFSRIAESIKGIFMGIALFLIAMPLIFWNECRAVDRAADLEFGQGAVVEANSAKVDSGNDKELVRVVGELKVDETLTDGTFSISANGLSLEREVEMYQWVEDVKSTKEKKTGGKEVTKKEYTYKQEWSGSLQNSSNFKEKDKVNPGSMPYESETFTAKAAKLGAYDVNPSLLGGLGTSETLTVTADQLKAMPPAVQTSAKLHNDGVYLGKDPLKPAIGDVRITFTVRKPGKATIIAGQYGSELRAFKHKKLNDPISLTANGDKSAEELFSEAQSANSMLTWILRLVTFFMMFGGLAAVFKPLSVVADVIPFIGSIVGTATSLVAFLIATPIWLLCVAMAWIVARPLVGILLLLGMALFIGALIAAAISFKKKKQAA